MLPSGSSRAFSKELEELIFNKSALLSLNRKAFSSVTPDKINLVSSFNNRLLPLTFRFRIKLMQTADFRHNFSEEYSF